MPLSIRQLDWEGIKDKFEVLRGEMGSLSYRAPEQALYSYNRIILAIDDLARALRLTGRMDAYTSALHKIAESNDPDEMRRLAREALKEA